MSHPRKHFSLLLKTFGNFGFDLLSGEGARDRARLLESLGRACSLTVDFLERPSRLSSTLGLIERSSLTFDFSFSLALDFFGSGLGRSTFTSRTSTFGSASPFFFGLGNPFFVGLAFGGGVGLFFGGFFGLTGLAFGGGVGLFFGGLASGSGGLSVILSTL